MSSTTHLSTSSNTNNNTYNINSTLHWWLYIFGKQYSCCPCYFTTELSIPSCVKVFFIRLYKQMFYLQDIYMFLCLCKSHNSGVCMQQNFWYNLSDQRIDDCYIRVTVSMKQVFHHTFVKSSQRCILYF